MQGADQPSSDSYLNTYNGLLGHPQDLTSMFDIEANYIQLSPACDDAKEMLSATTKNMDCIFDMMKLLYKRQEVLAFGQSAIMEKCYLLESDLTSDTTDAVHAVYSKMRAQLAIKSGIPVPHFPFDSVSDVMQVMSVRRHVEKITRHILCHLRVDAPNYVRSLREVVTTQRFKNSVNWKYPATM